MEIYKCKSEFYLIPTIVYSRFFYSETNTKIRYIDIKFLNYELTFKL
jgi:hypothetical protein